MSADSPQRFFALDADDLARLDRQRAFVTEAAAHLGLEPPRLGSLDDLAALQAILNANVLRKEQTWELQSLGIVLGDVFEKHTELHWVIVEDEYGRDPALRFGATSNLIFPLTMISKRVEEGRAVNVQDIYDSVMSYVEEFAE